MKWLILLLAACAVSPVMSQEGVDSPRTHVYRVVNDQSLHAYVFFPNGTRPDYRAHAVLLFHGGGWSVGSPEWTYPAARRFADAGLVAIAIEYRLSEGDVTPIDALDDACEAFAWARAQSAELGLTDRLVGYGVSAGGHLVAATVTVGCSTDSAGDHVGPDALLLWSPALDLSRDGWFRRILQGRAPSAKYSPVEHVNEWTPPTSIVHGEKDTLTPLEGARKFCDRLVRVGGLCELNVYEGVGHLLTRNLANQVNDFDPDPEARAHGIAQHLQFLSALDLIPKQ